MWMSWNWIDSKQCTKQKVKRYEARLIFMIFYEFFMVFISNWRIEKWEGIKSIISYLLKTINVIKDALTTRYWAFFMLYINVHTSEKERMSAKWWKYIWINMIVQDNNPEYIETCVTCVLSRKIIMYRKYSIKWFFVKKKEEKNAQN